MSSLTDIPIAQHSAQPQASVQSPELRILGPHLAPAFPTVYKETEESDVHLKTEARFTGLSSYERTP